MLDQERKRKMKINKRIILVGPTCAGKNFIRDKFKEKGYQTDVSYTSRFPRNGEKNGVDYNFISKAEFKDKIEHGEFYEWVEYGGNFYGTGLKEWKWCDIFIMETDGIKHIKSEDRKNCLIIFINSPLYDVRIPRMKERGWDDDKIRERVKVDNDKFKDFTDYDVEIGSAKQF
jgi:guanylate kinase